MYMGFLPPCTISFTLPPSAIERGLERHSEHPTIEPIYNPAVFARAPGLSADISCLLDVPESEWHSHPIHQSLLSPTIPPALQQFLSRLERLSFSSTPAPLLAHAYTRYMGDLGGGQSIRVGMAKAYGLDVHGQGVEFYLFKQLDCSAKATTQGELKKIKDWFRAGMDRAAGDDAALKCELSQLDESMLYIADSECSGHCGGSQPGFCICSGNIRPCSACGGQWRRRGVQGDS